MYAYVCVYVCVYVCAYCMNVYIIDKLKRNTKAIHTNLRKRAWFCAEKCFRP